jgi:FkbM family methyltransferase
MTIFYIFKNIWEHPFNKKSKLMAIWRFLRWQFISSLINYYIIYPLTQNSLILVKKGMTGVTGCIYNGLLEFEDMMFLLHFLRREDTFVDVGSNVGVYTILASSEIGAKVISIEPIKETFHILNQNVLLNKAQENVTLLNIGVGEKQQKLFFSSLKDTVNHVLTEKEILSQQNEVVQVEILDDILKNETPKIIKIDVEGFETNVINGAFNILSNVNLKAIIIELNGSGIRYGFDDNILHHKILSYGFTCYSYEPYKRKLKQIHSFGKHNTIYIKDFEYVNQRITTSKSIRILNQII